MSRFSVRFRGKDGKTRLAVVDGKTVFGPGAKAKVQRYLHKRHLPSRVLRRDKHDPGQRIVDVAASYIGTKERPPNSNWSATIAKFLACVRWSKPAPWCAAFACYVLRKAGYPLPYESASVPALETWARLHGRWVPNGQGRPQPGWLVVFEFSGDTVSDHIGVVRRQWTMNILRTIEGNTSAGDGGSQANGGMVASRTRNPAAVIHGKGLVRGYIRTY